MRGIKLFGLVSIGNWNGVFVPSSGGGAALLVVATAAAAAAAAAAAVDAALFI